MSTSWRRRAGSIVLRWFFGTALVSWRYMWQTTPLHRDERVSEALDQKPPRIPADLLGQEVQSAGDGVGRLFHRRFRVDIAGSKITAAELMAGVVHDFKHFVPTEVVGIRRADTAASENLHVGDGFVVEMPGPWDGPVRVTHLDDTCLRLATLRGHLEAGQVQFRSWPDGDLLAFQIDTWARSSTRLVHLLYAHLRLAKEIQLNMWVRFCKAATASTGGRPNDGIHIHTHQAPPSRPVGRKAAGVIG